jgi:hypothetical protein
MMPVLAVPVSVVAMFRRRRFDGDLLRRPAEQPLQPAAQQSDRDQQA